MSTGGCRGVSVVIPTFNRSALLRKAVDSALAQTYADVEVLVSDNGSTDDTREVVRSIDDPRFAYLPLPGNLGMIGNLNRCLRLGSAPYLLLLHDDDIMRPDNVAAKVAVLDANPDVAFVHSAFSFIDDDDEETVPWMSWGLPIDPIEPGPVFISRVFASGSRVSPSGTLLRRAALAGVYCDEEEKEANDVGMWLRMARNGSVAYLTEPLVALRRHSGSTTEATGVLSGYGATFERAAQVRVVKERFLRRYAGDGLPTATLRSLARRASRGDLTAAIRREVDRAPSRWNFISACGRAVRLEPTLPLSADLVELAALHFVGSRAASVVHRMRPRLRGLRFRLRGAAGAGYEAGD